MTHLETYMDGSGNEGTDGFGPYKSEDEEPPSMGSLSLLPMLSHQVLDPPPPYLRGYEETFPTAPAQLAVEIPPPAKTKVNGSSRKRSGQFEWPSPGGSPSSQPPAFEPAYPSLSQAILPGCHASPVERLALAVAAPHPQA